MLASPKTRFRRHLGYSGSVEGEAQTGERRPDTRFHGEALHFRLPKVPCHIDNASVRYLQPVLRHQSADVLRSSRLSPFGLRDPPHLVAYALEGATQVRVARWVILERRVED